MVDYPVAVDRPPSPYCPKCWATVAPRSGRSCIAGDAPYQEVVDPFTSHAGNLPIALETAKLDTLTDAITASFGSAPRIFRSGRYGLGASSLSLLASRGYRIDSSMRALHDYGATGGMDFSDIDAHGFRRDGMVELPLTSVYTGLLRQGGSELYRRPGAGRMGGVCWQGQDCSTAFR